MTSNVKDKVYSYISFVKVSKITMKSKTCQKKYIAHINVTDQNIILK